MFSIVTGFANGHQPFYRVFTNIVFCIFFMMSLRCLNATISTAPVVMFKYKEMFFSITMKNILKVQCQ